MKSLRIGVFTLLAVCVGITSGYGQKQLKSPYRYSNLPKTSTTSKKPPKSRNENRNDLNQSRSSSGSSSKNSSYIDSPLTEKGRDVFFFEPELPAQFPGGNKFLMLYLANNVQYPEDAWNNDIEGKVIVKFVVEKDGSIGETRILRSVHPLLDEEALRVVRSMPRWQPGKNNGVVVRSWFTLPVSFKISGKDRDATNDRQQVDDHERMQQIVVESTDDRYVTSGRNHNSEPEQIFTAVEQQAKYPGGQGALMKFLSSNIHYPESAQQDNIQGRVIVKFVVEKDGSIGPAQVVKGVEHALDQEALRVVREMPRWQPGKNDGVAVRSWLTLPVTFRLTEK